MRNGKGDRGGAIAAVYTVPVHWTPPPRWKQVPPRVEGIEAWAPSPEDVPTDLDVGVGLADTSGSFLASGAALRLVGPASGGSLEPADRPRAAGLGVDRRELVCAGCGAVLAVEAGPVAATCPLCASAQVVLRERHRGSGARPQAVLPFAVLAGEAKDRVRAWLGRGWFRPWDLVVLAHTEALTGMYVPFWLGAAEVDAEWRAQVGRERVERPRDLELGLAASRTVVDWGWESGRVRSLPARARVPGTTRLGATEIGEALAETSLEGLQDYEPAAVAGFQVLAADRALPEALDLGRVELAALAREACRAAVGAERVRSLSVTWDLRGEAWRPVLLPLWVSAYRYGDRTYVVVVDGSTGRVVGQKPVVWRRVGFAIAMLTAPGLLLTTIGLPLLFVAVGAVVLPMGLVLLVLGGLASAWIWSSAAASEER